MKKLSYVIVIAVLSLVGTTAYGQEIEETVEQVEQQEKVEIELSDLPEAVSKAIAADFAEYTADKAFKKLKDDAIVYFVTLAKGEEKIGLYYNAEGKLLEKKDL